MTTPTDIEKQARECAYKIEDIQNLSDRPSQLPQLVKLITSHLTRARAEGLEAAAEMAETGAAARCMEHAISKKGVCGYDIASALRSEAQKLKEQATAERGEAHAQ